MVTIVTLYFLVISISIHREIHSIEKDLGRLFQSIVSLTSLLVVKMLTALESTISNPQVFLLKKCA